MKDSYSIVFNFIEDKEKCILVKKKTKKINKVFFVPKSIILSEHRYTQDKTLWKDVPYEVQRIKLLLPKWYCDKELGFYK